MFREFVDDPNHYADRIKTHVIDPFRIPKHWKIVRSFDWGRAKPFSVGWWAVDEDGRMYRIRELYGCRPNQPNTGVEWEDDKIAREILRIEHDDENIKGHEVIGVADPAIGLDKSDNGYGTAAIMAAEGCYFIKGKNNRIQGKNQFHYRLAMRDDGRPMLQVFSTCVNFIKQIPALVYSTIDVEDVDTTQEDHIYDESKYALCTHMITQPIKTVDNKIVDDPLDMIEDKEEYRYIGGF